MLELMGIVEKMRAEGFEITPEDVAAVHQGMKDGRVFTGALDREIARRLEQHLGQAMSDGRVENAEF